MSTTEGLAEPLRSITEVSLAVARQQGRDVRVVSGLRTREQQIGLRRAHCGPTQYDIYEKPSSQCRPPTARPGSSKHETGQAVDIGGDKEWFARYTSQFNLVRNVPGEDWHFEWRGRDVSTELAKVERVARQAGITVAPGAVGASATGTLSTGSAVGRILSGMSGSIADAVGDVGLDDIPGPLGDLAEAAGFVGDVFRALSSRDWWVRIGWGALGVVAVVVGLVLLFRDPAVAAVQTVAGARGGRGRPVAASS